MNLIKKYPILASSADPKKVSMTIQSIGAWVIVGIIALTKANDWNIAESDLTALVNIVAVLVGSIMSGYGLARKIYIKFNK